MGQGKRGPPALHPMPGQVKGPGDSCVASKLAQWEPEPGQATIPLLFPVPHTPGDSWLRQQSGRNEISSNSNNQNGGRERGRVMEG